jgi:hypothetical protein
MFAVGFVIAAAFRFKNSRDKLRAKALLIFVIPLLATLLINSATYSELGNERGDEYTWFLIFTDILRYFALMWGYCCCIESTLLPPWKLLRLTYFFQNR